MDSEKFRNIESQYKSLAYNKELKSHFENNPNLIKTFFELVKKINSMPIEEGASFRKKGFTQESNGIKVTCEDIRRGNYTVEIDDTKYFVKYLDNDKEMGGYNEFISSAEAQARLKDLDWVEVIDFKLGYKDVEGRKVFVSEWKDLPVLESYMRGKGISLDTPLDEIEDSLIEERKDIEQKLVALDEALEDYYDVQPANMLYNPENGHITLFDLNQRAF